MIRKLALAAILFTFLAAPVAYGQLTFGDLREVTHDLSSLPLPGTAVTAGWCRHPPCGVCDLPEGLSASAPGEMSFREIADSQEQESAPAGDFSMPACR